MYGANRLGGESSRGRIVQGTKRPGGETSRQGAKRLGGETARGRNVQLPAYRIVIVHTGVYLCYVAYTYTEQALMGVSGARLRDKGRGSRAL